MANDDVSGAIDLLMESARGNIDLSEHSLLRLEQKIRRAALGQRREWQPIETVPKNRLFLVWMSGWEFHSDVRWKREGFALYSLHQDGDAKNLREEAIRRLIGPEGVRCYEYFLEPTHWMPLPAAPDPDRESGDT